MLLCTVTLAQGRPALGINLEAVSDWSRSAMFQDAIKSSRPFGPPDTPWIGRVRLDAHGWPMEDFGIVVFTHQPHAQGIYPLSFTGRAVVQARSDFGPLPLRLSYDAPTDRTTGTLTVGPSPDTSLFLSFRGTHQGVRNLRLLRPGAAPDQTFSPQFLAALAPFSTLRTMGLQAINDSPARSFAHRPHRDDAQQTGPEGICLEYLIDLANQTHKDLWLCVPDQAGDPYVESMADLLRTRLDPTRTIYVEWSNELWYPMFQQARRNLQAAQQEVRRGRSMLAEGGGGEATWAFHRQARRTVQIARIFHRVLGRRARPILAAKSGDAQAEFECLSWLDRHFGPPAGYLYGIAEAGYFGPSHPARTGADALRLFRQDEGRVEREFPEAGAVAHHFGLRHLAYEGGPSSPGAAGLAANLQAQHDPAMGDLLARELRSWYRASDDLFMVFELSGADSVYGQWGLYTDLSEPTPKSQAAVRISHWLSQRTIR